MVTALAGTMVETKVETNSRQGPIEQKDWRERNVDLGQRFRPEKYSKYRAVCVLDRAH